MDAFYAAVEVLQDPSLKGRALIVGGDGARGVVASCSYEARAFGVRSAMSSIQAKRLCPHAVFVPGNHGLYGDYSARIHDVFQSFTPFVEGIALDEAFLDVTGARSLFGSGSEAAVRVRDRILDEIGLTCSVGVATSKLLAKLASEAAKPNVGGKAPRELRGARLVAEGVVEVVPGDERTFLHPHPARALWGIGPKTFERLARFGVVTVGDLARLPEATVISALGSANGRHLHALANARDDRAVEPDRAMKSVGHEETFAVDQHELEPLRRELLRMADAVATRCRAASLHGRTIQLKLKLADFRLITRSKTVPVAIDTATAMYAAARALLEEPELAADVAAVGVRLLGVSMANFESASAQQLPLFDELSVADAGSIADPAQSAGVSAGRPVRSEAELREADQRLAGAMDAIRERFGAAAVGPAALAEPGGLRIKRPGDTQWGPSEPR